MTNLEKVVLEFDGRGDFIFFKYMKENHRLTSKEKVWKEASHFELWNFKEINVGRNNTLRF